MDITGATALVTGANRGIGREIAERLLARGAAKVYATARRPETIAIDGIEPLALDVNDPDSVAAAARVASDVDLLINNAGVATYSNLVSGELDLLRLEMETNYFGTLNVVRAFAPILAANGGGAILNVLSALSWTSYDGVNGYAASKAAAWSLTNGIRLELAEQGTLVTAIHLGAADTDMTQGYDGPKLAPRDVAEAGLDGIANGQLEVLADDTARQAKGAVGMDVSVVYADVVHG